jgi:hypothetical protein
MVDDLPLVWQMVFVCLSRLRPLHMVSAKIFGVLKLRFEILRLHLECLEDLLAQEVKRLDESRESKLIDQLALVVDVPSHRTCTLQVLQEGLCKDVAQSQPLNSIVKALCEEVVVGDGS